MSQKDDIPALARKLRRDLRNRFIVWPVLLVFFGVTSFVTFVRSERSIEMIAEWQLASDASPEWIRWSAIQGSIPITLHLLILTVNLLACGYCLLRFLQPRTEAKLLLAMIERVESSSQQAGVRAERAQDIGNE